MPKYENSVIYKLCHCNDLENENIYIGSTTNFRQRKNKHKSNCNNENRKEYNYSIYEYIRNNGEWNEWKMIPIEKYPCNGKEELEIRERYHIELLKSKLNKNIPTRTRKEYLNDNKDILNEKRKEYRNSNKEKIKELKKKHYDSNKEIINEKRKQYHNANREKLLKRLKEYRDANKEIINEKRREKIKCNHCGSEITKGGLREHQKTNKCKNYNITKE